MAVCLTLADRPEKWQKFESQEFPFPIRKHEGVKASPGGVGCRDSHFEILQSIEGVATVFEDDCFMLQDGETISRIMKELPNDWDALYLGATLNQKIEQYSEGLYLLQNAYTTHAIIYNGRKIPDFVLQYRDDIRKIDVFYAEVVQANFNCFITAPLCATQRPGYSDVINRAVDYSVIERRYNEFT